MRVFEKILCPIDFSDTSTNALRWTEFFAKRYGSSIVIMHSLEMNAYGGPVSADYTHVISRTQSALKDYLAPITMPYETVLATQGAPLEIADCAKKTGVTAIVMGTHGLKGISHKLLGSTTEEVVRHSNIPIITISPYCGVPPNNLKKKILLPVEHVDLISPSYEMFDQIVVESGSFLSLMHVVSFKEPAFATKCEVIPFNTFTFEAEQTKVALTELGKAMTGRDEAVETMVEFGDVAEGILDQADTGKYDYILMGAKHEKFIARFFDSVVYSVLCESPIPVITVKNP
jgi:nucleotide-binding universal stress UspA family protein